MTGDHGWQHEVNPYKVAYIHQYLKAGYKVLDLGSGRGFYSLLAREKQAIPTALDQEIHFDAKGENIDFIKGSLEEVIAADDQSFDAVFAWDIIEHVKNDDQLWSEIHRVLKPGGMIFVSVPHGDDHLLANCYLTYGHHTDKTHHREYLPEQLSEKAKQFEWRILDLDLKGGDAYPYLLLNFIGNGLIRFITKIYIKILFKIGAIKLQNCHGDIYVIFQKKN